MKILPMLVFAAAAGLGSGAMSFKQVSQLHYENVKLALQVHNLERKFASLRKQWLAREELVGAELSAAKERVRRGRAVAARREVTR